MGRYLRGTSGFSYKYVSPRGTAISISARSLMSSAEPAAVRALKQSATHA
jgi:hypothetical protein